MKLRLGLAVLARTQLSLLAFGVVIALAASLSAARPRGGRNESTEDLLYQFHEQFTTTTRTWTDSSGKHSVEAKFFDLEGDVISLKKQDDATITLDLDRLSSSDKAWVLNTIKGRTKLLFDILRSPIRIDEEEFCGDLGRELGTTTVRFEGKINEINPKPANTHLRRFGKPCLDYFVDHWPSDLDYGVFRRLLSLPGQKIDISKLQVADSIFFEGKLVPVLRPCTNCGGTGRAKCPHCHGKGTEAGPAQPKTQTTVFPNGNRVHSTVYVNPSVRCSRCGGSGTLPCKHSDYISRDWAPFRGASTKKRDDCESAIAVFTTASEGKKWVYLCLRDLSAWIVTSSSREKIVLGDMRTSQSK